MFVLRLNMQKILKLYFSISLILRIIFAFILGSAIGAVLWYISQTSSPETVKTIITWISPFGQIFVDMLKMIVVPVIFFSLLVGASSLPVSKFGRVGIKTISWYLICSFFAAVIGVLLALAINPGSGAEIETWQSIATGLQSQTDQIAQRTVEGNPLTKIFLSLFRNPFQALATGNFLPIIIFSIMFGLAIRVTMENHANPHAVRRLQMFEDILKACRDAMFKLVDWILEYSPIGVLALTIMNFGLHGPSIVGPYISVTLGVIAGITVMIFIVYPLLMWVVTMTNPFTVLRKIKEAMLMAFITRSSAATLPVSIKVAEEEILVKNELASFSLPLGATINMDGVCVHLPMFAVLAANMFNIELTISKLIILVITTVLSSIGAGGVPGGSLMLLFIILETMGLSAQQVSVIVALALGINPILDMFETMNNVTGDLVCTYTVAKREGLIQTLKPHNAIDSVDAKVSAS